MTAPWYVPPAFGLFEAHFEDSSSGRREERWVADWQGLIGQPAESVSLGLTTAGEPVQTLVATRLRGDSGAVDQRIEALRLAAARRAAHADPLETRGPTDLVHLAATLPRVRERVLIAGIETLVEIMPFSDVISSGYALVGDRVMTFATSAEGLESLHFEELPSLSSGGYPRDPLSPMTRDQFAAQDRPLRGASRDAD